jgi:hypothetical protein
LLADKVRRIGPKWSVIAQSFPGRTDIGIKNHYISVMARKQKEAENQDVLFLSLGEIEEGQEGLFD